MKIFITGLCICFITCSPPLKNENSPSMHGTLFIGAIATDGIVIAIDSRLVIFDKSNGGRDAIAYLDNTCKLYKLKNYNLAVTGNPFLGTKHISDVIQDFNRSHADGPITNIAYFFSDYVKSHYGRLWNNRTYYFVSGYFQGVPHIVGLGTEQEATTKKDFLVSNENAVKYLKHFQSKLYKVSEILPEMIHTIREFPKEYNLTSEIGGPISVLHISSNNEMKILQNDFSANVWNNPAILAQKMESGAVHATEIVPGGIRKAIQVMKTFGH